MNGYGITKMLVEIGLRVKRDYQTTSMNRQHLTLYCSVNERTEMKLKIYLSDAWMCSEFGYQHPMSIEIGLIMVFRFVIS